MRKLCFIIICSICILGNAQERNFLSGNLQQTQIQQWLQNFQPNALFDFINHPEILKTKISDFIQHQYIKEAEKYLNKDWPYLPVTVFMEYVQNGNRTHYEDLLFARRKRLGTLVLAEMIERKQRFLNDIINGTWLICEESFWGIPAHIGEYNKRTKGLPDINENIIDLFAAETGSLMSWTDFLLQDEFSKTSPTIHERIQQELKRRIIIPYITKDFGWMGFKNGSKPNNWNPWINSNVLTVALLSSDSLKNRAALVYKAVQSIDKFINGYPDDGGCDEGPAYWAEAPGALLDCLELLYKLSDKQLNIYQQPLIKAMGAYIYKLHINQNYYVNFADAPAKVAHLPTTLFLYGKRCNDSLMMQFAAAILQPDKERIYTTATGALFRPLYSIDVLNELKTVQPKFPFPAQSWLPQTQVVTMRSNEGTVKGFFVGALGGHNNESHNHNDVGNFILYYDGQPVIVDAGVGDYIAQTFSSRRYEIWTMRSSYHNLPSVNGYEQLPGAEYKATNVSFINNADVRKLSMDISKAYPAKAGINFWKRDIILKNNAVTVTDNFQLQYNNDSSSLYILCFKKPQIESGKLTFAVNDTTNVYLLYSGELQTPTIETISIAPTDKKLSGSWGKELYRLTFKINKAVKGNYTLQFTDK